MIDSHIHLSYGSAEERGRSLQEVREAGVEAFIAVSENAARAHQVVEAAAGRGAFFWGARGPVTKAVER